jgi:hypothetical protein
MIERTAWPGEKNPIKKIWFALMTGFDPQGQPVYVRGKVESAQEREMVQSLLAPLRPAPLSIASVTMGEVNLELEDGSTILLRPVFHPSLKVYRDLFMVDQWQYPLPRSLAALFDRWRKEAERVT